MTDQPVEPVTVSRTIDASAEEIFLVLSNPAEHPAIDGSGMLRGGPDRPVSAVGDVFAMKMHNHEMGDYEMANHVVEFEPNRRIAWEPVLNAASRPEDRDQIGVPGGVRWGFELEPIGPKTTLVTEVYDCTRSEDWLKRAVKGGTRWVESMTATLEKLGKVAATGEPV